MAKSSRREIRDSAMKLLFETSMRDDPIETLYGIAEEIDEIIVNDEVRALVDGTLAHQDEFDALIQKYSPKRSISRIPKLTLTIIRLAMYEIMYDEGTPTNAAISEAVQLAENYTYYEEDVRFLNGLLGAYARDLGQKDSAGS
jgi:N utilization substance protein B